MQGGEEQGNNDKEQGKDVPAEEKRIKTKASQGEGEEYCKEDEE